jgi:hypothetical protein
MVNKIARGPDDLPPRAAPHRDHIVPVDLRGLCGGLEHRRSVSDGEEVVLHFHMPTVRMRLERRQLQDCRNLAGA